LSPSYFEQVRAATGTRFWVNNPTAADVVLALRHGAMGCTTNPAFAAGLLGRAPGEVLPVIRECVAADVDDHIAAERVQESLVAAIATAFRPLYDGSGGTEGYVSIQGAPGSDADSAAILREAASARAIAPNVTPKLPATTAGLDALDVLVADGSPVIVTEVFSVAQVIAVCERWLAASRRGGVRPPFFMSPITGIFGDYLRATAEREGLAASEAAISQAGVLVAKACYRVVRERDYPVVLLFGGSRSSIDFTGLMGAGMATTINWSTAEQLLASRPEIGTTIDAPVDPAIELTLGQTFADVRAALDADGLKPDGFADFGPVRYFRDIFVAGWDTLLAAVRAARVEPARVRG
jgi:transaldolase